MGKALIVSSQGEGLYKAKLQPDRVSYDRTHARLVADIANLQIQLDALSVKILTAEVKESEEMAILQDLINKQ